MQFSSAMSSPASDGSDSTPVIIHGAIRADRRVLTELADHHQQPLKNALLQSD